MYYEHCLIDMILFILWKQRIIMLCWSALHYVEWCLVWRPQTDGHKLPFYRWQPSDCFPWPHPRARVPVSAAETWGEPHTSAAAKKGSMVQPFFLLFYEVCQHDNKCKEFASFRLSLYFNFNFFMYLEGSVLYITLQRQSVSVRSSVYITEAETLSCSHTIVDIRL